MACGGSIAGAAGVAGRNDSTGGAVWANMSPSTSRAAAAVAARAGRAGPLEAEAGTEAEAGADGASRKLKALAPLASADQKATHSQPSGCEKGKK